VTKDASLSSGEIMMLPKSRAEGPEDGWGCPCSFPSSSAGAYPLAAWEERWLSGSLKYFLLGAVVLAGLGTSTSPQLHAWKLSKSKH